jgi:type VI secretion system secreted protein VgrG
VRALILRSVLIYSSHTTLISLFTAMTRPAPLGITADFAALADLFAAARFTDATRLYAFASDGLPELLVESFCGIETVCGAGAGAQWVVDVLSMQAGLPIRDWRFKQAALGIRQADGFTQWRSGYVQKVQQLDADGGLARYRLTLVPGVWLTTQGRRNRIFQNKPLLQVIEEVLAPYAPYVRWQIDTGVDTLLGELAPRPMIVQYQESDYMLITRLLAEEGLGWSVVESAVQGAGAPSGESPDFSAGAAHALHLFASGDSFTQDVSSAAEGGIRWHQAGSQEEADALFDWRHTRSLRSNQTTTLSWAWAHKRALVAVESSSSRPAHVPDLERFSDAHDSRQQSNSDAAHYARLQQTHIDSSQWQIGCASSVRSLAVHSWFDFVNYAAFNQTGFDQAAFNSPGDDPTQASQFNVLSVLHAGINNLPRVSQVEVQRSVALLADELARTAPHPAFPYALADLASLLPSLMQRLVATGYANCAQLIPKRLPLQPWLPRQPHVAAGFTLPARVVGPNGETTPGNEEIYADANNRVRVAFFWQQGSTPDDRSTCWVPVMQRAAGPTRGVHILPRIGQEVLVGFLHGQMDQPIVLASAYNGRGEGSRLAHEDRSNAAAPALPFDQATDARIAGQSNRVGHGNSPVWHGAAGVDHNHAAALLGMRSKEWGGAGFNQLLFDDSDQQLAVQVATTQYTTQLNLGHLRHRADNYRGSFRGTGFEMRTDAYGAVRAKQGVMLTTWGKDAATPTGDAAAAQRLLATARDTGKNLSNAAGTHQTVRFTSDAGVQSGKLSALRDDQAPLAAFAHALEGMVAGKDRAQALADAQSQSTTPDTGKVPHPTDPLLLVAGRGGIGLTATEVQIAVGHTHTELAGAHHYTGVQGQTRVHTGQGIGMLGGAIQANDGIGLQLIAGNGDILTQAQSDTLTVASQKDMTISAGQPIDFAAAKKIVIKTAAGATIEIGSGGINVTAPGSFTVHAASHQFVSGGGMNYSLPELPTAEPTKHSLRWKVISAVDGRPANAQDAISMSRSKEVIQSAQTGKDGRSSREFAPAWPEDRTALLGSGEWVVDVDSELDPIAIEWDEDDEDEPGFTGSESV